MSSFPWNNERGDKTDRKFGWQKKEALPISKYPPPIQMRFMKIVISGESLVVSEATAAHTLPGHRAGLQWLLPGTPSSATCAAGSALHPPAQPCLLQAIRVERKRDSFIFPRRETEFQGRWVSGRCLHLFHSLPG